jgi:acyl-CoA reductase-like NAD-dependent aldehyde dehydrogenase
VAFATRRDILLRAAATLKSEEWQKKAASAMQAEVAMSRMHALFNFVAGFELLASVAGVANDLKGMTLPSTVPGGHVFIQRRAQGVVYVLILIVVVAELNEIAATRWSRGMLQFHL